MARPKGSKNKTKDNVPGAAALKGRKKAVKAAPLANGSVPGNNTVPDDADLREAFVSHVSKFRAATAKLETARKGLREVKAELRMVGFTVAQIEVAILLDTPEGETKIRNQIAANIRAARWMGSSVGTQFTFDLDTPDRTPSVDRAKDEGVRASMEGASRQPPAHYHPGTPQYGAWFTGYDEHQTARIRGGIKAPADARPRHLQRRDAEMTVDSAFEGDGTTPAA